MAEVFAEPLYRRYHAPRFSSAYLFSLFCYVVLLIMPFFLAYPFHKNGGIWLKHDTYWEQPKTTYQYKTIIVMQVEDASGSPSEIFHSTIGGVNALRPDSFRTATIRSREIDNNLDGVMDQLYFSAVFPLSASERVYSAHALLVFNYTLQDRIKIDTDAMVYVAHDSGLAGSGLFVNGDLNLIQRYPIEIRDQSSTLYAYEPLLDEQSGSTQIDVSVIKNIVEKYSRRLYANVRMDNILSLWSRAMDTSSTNDGQFNFTLTINIPEQGVRYIPKAADVLKDAWIKYLSLFVVVSYLLRSFCSFVFNHQM